MLEWLKDFFTSTPFVELLLILVAKIVEVSIGTLRVILVSKGYRTKATLISFVEIMLWVFIASTVINGISEAPIKGLFYGIGFSLGVFFGSILENKLAFGKVLLQVICSKDKEKQLVTALRDKQIGVTVLAAEGKDSPKGVLLMFLNRKGKDHIVDIIASIDAEAMVVANEISTLRGGYFNSIKNILK